MKFTSNFIAVFAAAQAVAAFPFGGSASASSDPLAPVPVTRLVCDGNTYQCTANLQFGDGRWVARWGTAVFHDSLFGPPQHTDIDALGRMAMAPVPVTRVTCDGNTYKCTANLKFGDGRWVAQWNANVFHDFTDEENPLAPVPVTRLTCDGNTYKCTANLRFGDNRWVAQWGTAVFHEFQPEAEEASFLQHRFPFLSFTLANLYPSLLAFPKNGTTRFQRLITSSTSNPAAATRRLPPNTPQCNTYSTFNFSLTSPIIQPNNITPTYPSNRTLNYSRRHASSAQTRTTLTPAEQGEIFARTPQTGVKQFFSVRRQIAAEGEWLQDNTDDDNFSGVQSSNRERFDWRKRAFSRRRPDPNENPLLPKPFKRRTRGLDLPLVEGAPFYNEFKQYSDKFLKLLVLEEAEDEAAHKRRLSEWSLERLKKEGYCVTGLSAYWLEQNQFGRPIASFGLGPGVVLPENKFENGTQVMISRLDPLAEEPVIGSVLSRSASDIRVCFPNLMDLSDGVWRLDLGRPNIMYDRMRTAISNMANDINYLEDDETASHESILQGTRLRDVLLRHLSENSAANTTSSEDDAEKNKSTPKPMQKFEGAFKDDQRINSWARRYSRPNPIVIDGDPPLPKLNSSQTRAVAAMIGERISLIQGPPGTGKTKTLIETVKLLKVGFEVPHPILVCTYTNVAVDNLVEGFVNSGVKPLRVGYNGNVRQSAIEYTLDSKLAKHPLHPTLEILVQDGAAVEKSINDLLAKYEPLERKIAKTDKPRKSTIARAHNMKNELIKLQIRHKMIKKKTYALQQQMLRDVVADADVICTTCITTACNALNVVDFPVVFLDEASMSTEPASLIPIMKGSRHLALIGDHKQLPPVIVNRQAKEEGLGVSLFERLTEEGHVPTFMLEIQYRMHPAISHFPSKEFYNFALLDGTVDAGGKALPGLEPPSSMQLLPNVTAHSRPSVVFLDHTGDESFHAKSRMNVMEGHIVMSIVEDLLLSNKGLRGSDIGIIAPYAAQIKMLTRFLNTDETYRTRFKEVLGDHLAMQLPSIEIKTVDGFEGREKEVIIFSTVRNNAAGHIGFLADKKRLNVGLTRAKRGLFVVGSISTLRASQRGSSSSGSAEPDVVASVVKGGKGADSWRRYAEYLVDGNLVISLTGSQLERGIYGHLRTAQYNRLLAQGLVS